MGSLSAYHSMFPFLYFFSLLSLFSAVNLAGISHIQQEGQDGYFDPLPEASREVAQDKWDWLEDFMETSEAQYLLIGGHYPVRL